MPSPPRPARAALAATLIYAMGGFYGGGEPLEGLAGRNPDDRGPSIVWDVSDAGADSLPDIPFPNDVGAHAFRLPDPSRPFDTARFQIRQIAWYFATRGRDLSDDPCLAAPEGCEFFGP